MNDRKTYVLICATAQHLPTLGIGISTEYGASTTPGALDVLALRQRYPQFAAFLEIGVEVVKGLDTMAHDWIQSGLPTTYHFLDINLDESEDFDEPWLAAMQRLTQQMHPAWLCGDAGLWHLGRRERGHMLLLPPILSHEAACGQAEGIMRLRQRLGYEVLPENPPGHVFLGDLHILDFFATVLQQADTGMLLDCAHLAMYQRCMGYAPRTALDGFPLDRIVELHVAGSAQKEHDGFVYWDDDHTPEVLADTWEIFDWVAPRAPHLKAVVLECERNALEAVVPGFQRLATTVADTVLGCSKQQRGGAVSAMALQRVVVRMLFDATFRDRVYANPGAALSDVDLTPQECRWLVTPDARAYSTDQYRQSRTLTGLLEEYPVAGALAMRCAHGAQRLHAFFASVFHQCIQQRGSMAEAFGSYMASPTFADHPELAPLAQVEQGIASVRRASYGAADGAPPLTAETRLRLAPWVAPVGGSYPDVRALSPPLQAFAATPRDRAGSGTGPGLPLAQGPLPAAPAPDFCACRWPAW